MKHVFRISYSLLKILLLKIPMILLGYIAVLFALIRLNDNRTGNYLHDQRLTGIFKYWDVGDSIDQQYGVNGDLHNQEKYNLNSKLSIFLMRYYWLAIRNPANYFQNAILGVKSTEILKLKTYYNKVKDQTVDIINDKYIVLNYSAIKEVSDYHNEGIRYIEVETKNGILYEYYLVKKLFGTNKCLRVRLGNKLGHRPLEQNKDYVQFAGTIGIATYEGK